MVEVMFWKSNGAAVLIGTTSKWFFSAEADAFAFIEAMHLDDVIEVTVNGYVYPVIEP